MIRLQNIGTAGLLATILFAGATACAAELADIAMQHGSGDPVAGKFESGLCKGCHGAEGIGFVELIPNLAGQNSGYTAKQMRDFQSGARTHQIMSAISRSVTATELADISAYFAGLRIMQGNGSGANPFAEKLFHNGDPARGIPACAGCHGEKGKIPVKASYPVIGGQHAEYLRVQLFHFRGGDRGNSPDGMMNRAAKNLTDAEIESLSDYLSGL
ncbi:MAG: c-type cytochrome [Gallionella sp.]